jgi:hypothetical protein
MWCSEEKRKEIEMKCINKMENNKEVKLEPMVIKTLEVEIRGITPLISCPQCKKKYDLLKQQDIIFNRGEKKLEEKNSCELTRIENK